MRPTRVEIDLCAIKNNLAAIRARTGTRIMMAIKADAYGHGARVVGRFVQERNLVDMLGVSCIEEGIVLRESGVSLPILIFGLITNTREDCDAIFSHHLTPTLVDNALTESLINGARRWNRPIGVHIKTDTGMGRLGLTPEETFKLAAHLSQVKEITLNGIYTHFPVSDIPGQDFTFDQIARFGELLNRMEAKGLQPGLRHCANSGAILNHPESFMDIVRPGILCYGLYPAEGLESILNVIPAMTLKTAIMFVKRVKKGTGLSYGLTYRSQKDTYIATIPIGYADGYPRCLSNKSRMAIRGKTYPVVGRVCMDQSLIDLGEDSFPPGEEVTVFGRDGITAQTVASWGSTIPYEVTCNMSRRVPRTYSNDR